MSFKHIKKKNGCRPESAQYNEANRLLVNSLEKSTKLMEKPVMEIYSKATQNIIISHF